MLPRTITATSEVHFALARGLFLEYAESLGIDLGFQKFDQEVAEIERVYGPPSGCLLLSERGGATVGCVGVRRLDADTCEMKRLYVQPAHRGLGIGLELARLAVARAGAYEYRRMRLDTLASMHAALGVYRALGFFEIPAYYESPIPETVFLELGLPSDQDPQRALD